jgi:hypothetical protein
MIRLARAYRDPERVCELVTKSGQAGGPMSAQGR